MSTGRIRITDLRHPEPTDIQKLALDHGERHPVDLTVEAVLGAAVKRTGLVDFGPDDFRARLGLWLDEVDSDAERTALGRLTLFGDCVRYAVNRLRIHDTLTRHPEIEAVEIRRPVIVVGLPRSGTTHLVNLIAADTRLRSLPLWESYEPVPDPTEQGGSDRGTPPDEADPRYGRAEAQWQGMEAMLPALAAMHPMRPHHIHEELELQLPDFSSYQLEWVARVPRWRDWYLSNDQTPHYRYLKSVLQILQWRRPGERWVLKSPQHLEQLGPLLSTFPDATVVVTHRDPVSVVQSAATMMTYAARMSYRTPDPDFYLSYWTDRIRRLLEASFRDHHLVPADRRVDVLFHEFMADDAATVERVYATAGLDMTAQARSQIGAYLSGHPRGKEGQVVYDLRQDFGVTPDEVRRPFGFYHDAVAVRTEVI